MLEQVSVWGYLEKMFLQGSGYAAVPNSVMTTLFSVMARTYASVLMNLSIENIIYINSSQTVSVLLNPITHVTSSAPWTKLLLKRSWMKDFCGLQRLSLCLGCFSPLSCSIPAAQNCIPLCTNNYQMSWKKRSAAGFGSASRMIIKVPNDGIRVPVLFFMLKNALGTWQCGAIPQNPWGSMLRSR